MRWTQRIDWRHRLSWPAVIAVGFSCGSEKAQSPLTETPSVDAGVVIDAAPEADAAITILPYPPGPYRGGVGDVMPDFAIRGYALSRTNTDSTRLPFRSISLAEVRSEPGCTCVAIVVSTCGTQCGPCVLHDRTITTVRTQDPSICAMEVLSFNYDGNSGALGENEPQPPTRADIDAFTQNGRENYPVGIPTKSATAALTDDIIHAIPMTYVLRASDMRVLAYLEGSGENFAESLARACKKTRWPVRDLATGISPRKIATDDEHVYASDWNAGIIRVPTAGGNVEVLYKDAEAQDTVRVDDVNLYFVSEGATAYTIKSIPKTGGAPSVVTTSATPISDFVLDGTNVIYASADGSISAVAKSGGAKSLIVSGESAPFNVRADATHVYWIAQGTGDVARAPKSGGARATIVPRYTFANAGGDPKFLEVIDATEILVANGGEANRFAKDGSNRRRLFGLDAINAFAMRRGIIRIATRHPTFHVGTVFTGSSLHSRTAAVTPGQPNVNSVTVGERTDSWAINDDDVSLNAGAIRTSP